LKNDGRPNNKMEKCQPMTGAGKSRRIFLAAFYLSVSVSLHVSVSLCPSVVLTVSVERECIHCCKGDASGQWKSDDFPGSRVNAVS